MTTLPPKIGRGSQATQSTPPSRDGRVCRASRPILVNRFWISPIIPCRWAALAAARAPGHEPHDDEDGHRDEPDEGERLERGKDPARSGDGKPHGEDRAEDCP